MVSCTESSMVKSPVSVAAMSMSVVEASSAGSPENCCGLYRGLSLVGETFEIFDAFDVLDASVAVFSGSWRSLAYSQVRPRWLHRLHGFWSSHLILAAAQSLQA